MRTFPWETYSTRFITRDISFESGRLHSINRKQVDAVAMRVIRDGKMGFLVNTGVYNEDQIYNQTAQLAKIGSQFPANFYKPSALYPVCKTSDESIKQLADDRLVNMVMEQIDELKKVFADGSISAQISTIEEEIRIKNSMGLEVKYPRCGFSFYICIDIIEDTSFFYAYDSLNRTVFEPDLGPVTRRVIGQLRLPRKPVSFTTGTYPVIFTPRAVASLIFVLKNGLDAHNIYRKVSPLTDKIGEKCFDERFSLIDDGTLATSPVCAPCDDEGVPMVKKYLIENGVVTNIINDLETASKLDMEPTGNGPRCRHFVYPVHDYTAKPSPSPTNWAVPAGTVAYGDMLADIKKGVVVDQLLGLHTGNLLNGDFSCNISSGYMIDNGRLSGRIKDCVIAGNLYSILADRLLELSRDDRQVDITGIHRFPYMYCKDISIAAQ